MGFFGDIVGGLFDMDEGEKNRDMQYDFARNAIQWKVSDAKKAGVHPLYAMGANTVSATPVQTNAGSNFRNAVNDVVNRKYERELQAKNMEKLQSEIDLNKSKSMSYIAEYKRASNLSRSTQTGRTAGNANKLNLAGGGQIDTKGLTPSDEFEKYFGSAGEIYGAQNLYYKLKDQAPDAWDSLKTQIKTPIVSAWRDYKRSWKMKNWERSKQRDKNWNSFKKWFRGGIRTRKNSHIYR